METIINITKELKFHSSELKFQFSRSGGHGGQNVNKVETKVELLFDVVNSTTLNNEQKMLILKKIKTRIDELGILHIVAQRSRYQSQNRRETIKKFIELIRKAITPKKKRIATKPTLVGKEKRVRLKKRRSEIKKMRRKDSFV